MAQALPQTSCCDIAPAPPGLAFLPLEDHTGMPNVIIWPDLAFIEGWGLLASTLPGVDRLLECQKGGWHLIAHHLHCHDDLLGHPKVRACNFC